MTGAGRLGAAALVSALLVLTAGCGDKGESAAEPDAGGDLTAAADTSTCRADAHPVTDLPSGYPTDFPLPPGTVVYHVEDRGADGLVATGVTRTAFPDVLSALNAAKTAGFKVTEGETEDHDAEANWTGNGYTGRWAIRESSACPGETVIQLLSRQG
ncbi:MAG: hypothetical protein QOH37_1626 [Nocardioidaceae bacterium]|nr:hypothetical protein [Nocardioidaceae bacterium]